MSVAGVEGQTDGPLHEELQPDLDNRREDPTQAAPTEAVPETAAPTDPDSPDGVPLDDWEGEATLP